MTEKTTREKLGVVPLLKEIFHKKKTKTWETIFDIDVASASTGTPTSRIGKSSKYTQDRKR